MALHIKPFMDSTIKERYKMLTGLRIFFGLLTIAISIYSLSTKDVSLFPYVQLSLALMFIIIGISERKAERKDMGMTSFFVSGFLFFVAIIDFFLIYNKKSCLSQAAFPRIIQTLSQVRLYLGLTRNSLSVLRLLSHEVSLGHTAFRLPQEFL